MSATENHPEAGLLRMLRAALRAGLAPGADDESFAMARSAAQIIGLPGLDACLAALDPLRGPAWSTPALEVVESLEQLATGDSLAGMRASDAGLLIRADALRRAATRASEVPAPSEAEEPLLPPIEPPRGTLSVEEALVDLPLSGDTATGIARRARLDGSVATALRAALEWLLGDAERPRPFRLRAEDSVLEVQCENVRPEALLAAHEVLADTDGGLAPLGETSMRAAAGAWLVRVPAWSPRPVHLMLEQGSLRLAVPWHAVLRLSLVPSIEIEMRGGSLATPVLPTLAPLASGVGERPVVAIAHGLKRALLVADRLVWRLGAEPCEPTEASPAAVLTRAVCSEEGEVFWVAEPRVLLADVELPVIPSATPRPPKPAPVAKDLHEPRVLAFPAAPAGAEPAVELTAGDVEPLVLDEAHVEALPVEASDPVELSAADVELAPIETPATVDPGASIEEAHAVVPAARIEEAAGSLPAGSAPIAAATNAAAEIALPEEPVALSTGDLIVDPPHMLPEWLERFGAAGAGLVREEPNASATPHASPSPPESAASHGFAPSRGSAAPRTPAAPQPPVAPRAAASVLIAEDSMAARHFLSRLFEQRGWFTFAVETAADLRKAVATGTWALVCVDVELPDARGAQHLSEIRTALEASGVPLLALVRDDEDAGIAEAAGVRRWLRKPFDREELEHALARLGLSAGNPA